MTDSAEAKPSVLIAEDEAGLADLYSVWLREAYDVNVTYNGAEALEQMDESIHVVILDRRMPLVSGDEALAEIRDRGYDVPVAMISAVDPEVNLLDLDCTDYIIKPVDREELMATVDRMMELSKSATETRQYYQLVAKRRALNASQTNWKSESPDRYDALQSDIERLKEQVELSQSLQNGLPG